MQPGIGGVQQMARVEVDLVMEILSVKMSIMSLG
jgi:hypothetical protein